MPDAQRSTLTILVATCEVALERSQVADEPLDAKLIADLERVIEGRAALARLVQSSAARSAPS